MTAGGGAVHKHWWSISRVSLNLKWWGPRRVAGSEAAGPGRTTISGRAARKMLAAEALTHPRVTGVSVKLRRRRGRYEAVCSITVSNIAGWRTVVEEVRGRLRDAIARDLGTTGEVYVAVHGAPATPVATDWGQTWVEGSAPGTAATPRAAGSGQAASPTEPEA